MRNIIIMLLVSINLLAMGYKDVKFDHKIIKNYRIVLNHLSPIQYALLKKVYVRFNKVNLGITGVSILLQESVCGKYLFNPTTGDYGIMMVNLETYLSLKKIKPSYYKNIEIASILIKDEDVNIQASIENMMFWKKYHKGNWIKMLGSYNGGSVPNYNYSYKLFNIAIAFRRWMKKHPSFKEEIKNETY